jgi:hypothetical protein
MGNGQIELSSSTCVGIELTEAILPVAVAAATVRLDCRKAFLNIVKRVQRSGREVSLNKRCNWGKEVRGEEECGWMEGELCRRGWEDSQD